MSSEIRILEDFLRRSLSTWLGVQPHKKVCNAFLVKTRKNWKTNSEGKQFYLAISLNCTILINLSKLISDWINYNILRNNFLHFIFQLMRSPRGSMTRRRCLSVRFFNFYHYSLFKVSIHILNKKLTQFLIITNQHTGQQMDVVVYTSFQHVHMAKKSVNIAEKQYEYLCYFPPKKFFETKLLKSIFGFFSFSLFRCAAFLLQNRTMADSTYKCAVVLKQPTSREFKSLSTEFFR